MKITSRRSLTALASAGLLAAIGLSSAAVSASTAPHQTAPHQTAPHQAAAPGNASRTFTATQQRAASQYWTRSRRMSAKPLGMTVTRGRSAPRTAAATAGAATYVPPSGAGAATSATLVAGRITAGPVPRLTSYAYPAPFTRFALFPASQYNVYPNRTHGKLFFSQLTPSGVGNFVCSGTVVTSVDQWLVETAGHCVANSSSHTFSFNVEFVPAYDSGAAPFGVWTGSTLWTKTAWINGGNLREDRGFVIVNRNPAGHSIQSVTGSEGIAFNQGYLQHVVDFGYPAAAPFNGATEQLCLASFEETDPFDTEVGSVPWGIACDQTGGSSGGGWVIRYGPGGGFVNGHNDYKYTVPSRPLEMFSPYFDNSELSLYNCATDNVC